MKFALPILAVALRAVLNFLQSLPIAVLTVYVLLSAGLLLFADPSTVTFADYVRSIQGLRGQWLALTVLAAAVMATLRLALRPAQPRVDRSRTTWNGGPVGMK